MSQTFRAMRLSAINTSQPCTVDALEPTPIKLLNKQIYLQVFLNGVATIGMLDTGASFTLITPEFAAAAGVTPSPETERMAGVAGSFTTQVGIAKSVQFGTVGFSSPQRVHIAKFGGSHGKELGANVGLDWLDGLDFDLDLRAETITAFKTSNCFTVEPPWRTTYSGVLVKRAFDKSVTGVSPGLGDILYNRQISVPVVFGDTAIEAEVDTGSTTSFLSHDSALDAGASRAKLRADRVVKSDTIDGRTREFYLHVFHNAKIGEDILADFPTYVAQSFDRRDPHMLLGMNYIGTHHLWLSFTTGVLYIDSGEPRKPIEPLDTPHWIAGSRMPIYPADARGEKGEINAQCMIEASGALDQCKITSGGEHAVFAKAVLHWLTNGYGPIYQPAFRNGKAIAVPHTWDINFGG